MPRGFDDGTTTTSVLRVKTTGFEQSPFALSWFVRVMLAEAKTSAGAPCWICADSMFEPANEYRGAWSIFGKTSVSEAAAYTVIWAVGAADAGAPTRAAATARMTMRRHDTADPLTLNHHVGRLHDRGQRHAVPQAEL